VTRNLRKDDARGNSQEVPVTIEFTISSFSTSDEAKGARMDDAIIHATAAFEHILPQPLCDDTINVDGDASPSVNDIFTVVDSWEPFLEKIKLCTEIVDKMAEVLTFANCFYGITLTFVFDFFSLRSILMQRWRGPSYLRHTGYVFETCRCSSYS
jgi:hypothetical protein